MEYADWQLLPDAIYFDTNALLEATFTLDAPWMAEVRSLAQKANMGLYVPELVADEWTGHMLREIGSKVGKATSALRFLRSFGIDAPEAPDLADKVRSRSDMKEWVGARLAEINFRILPHAEIRLEDLIKQALEHRAPFTAGDKGFRDTLIVESIISHAATMEDPKVLVVTTDKDVGRSGFRFKRASAEVRFAKPGEVVEMLKSLESEEFAAFLEQHQAELGEFVGSHEAEVLKFVASSPLQYSTGWLDNVFGGGVGGSVTKVIEAKPTGIANVLPGVGPFADNLSDDRYPISISVAIRMHVEIEKYAEVPLMGTAAALSGLPPAEIDERSPLVVERPSSWPQKQTVEEVVERQVRVEASVSSAAKKEGRWEDLKLHKAS
jgi:PIN domain